MRFNRAHTTSTTNSTATQPPQHSRMKHSPHTAPQAAIVAFINQHKTVENGTECHKGQKGGDGRGRGEEQRTGTGAHEKDTGVWGDEAADEE